MWPFHSVKKDRQNAQISASEKDLRDAHRRYSDAISLMKKTHTDEVRQMLQGLLPARKDKPE